MCSRACGVIALLLATSLCLHSIAFTAATPKYKQHRCGTSNPTRKTMQTVQARVAAASQQSTVAGSGFVITVPVVWHVIFARSASLAVKVAKQRKQLDLIVAQMNSDFNTGAPAGYSYKFVSTSPTLFHKITVDENDNAWCSGSLSENSLPIKARFRRGDACTLNIYITDTEQCSGFFGPPYLGVSTFPWNLQVEFAGDGVILDPVSVPGFNVTPAHVTTHEVGHWFGLLHTFQYDWTTANSVEGNDGCRDPWGDFVADTPKEERPHYGDGSCADAFVTDSCPLDKGKDPWWNQMSYFDCEKQKFSKGQHVRMKTMHNVLRKPYCLPPPTPQQGPIKFGPDCTNSRVVNGTAKGCCNTQQGFYCYEYKQAGSPASTYATCMTPSACKASASGNPAWQCRRKAACHK